MPSIHAYVILKQTYVAAYICGTTVYNVDYGLKVPQENPLASAMASSNPDSPSFTTPQKSLCATAIITAYHKHT